LYSLGHGGNDTQKTTGIIASLLFSAGLLDKTFHTPFWTAITCHAAIALGTMFDGWRIVKTIGQKVAKLKPVDGFCAETGAAIMLFISSALGIPVSTTHIITGAIERMSAIKWGGRRPHYMGMDTDNTVLSHHIRIGLFNFPQILAYIISNIISNIRKIAAIAH